ncbi:hypothetical protein MMC34_006091 [Xylographa carneopallida]|nr:hypothetical protein [Xylographa carneopallida]
MPLHLLGKKSWNVYNTANIEKVKADEAAAAAREAAEEQRMQEVDAERRIQVLRGLEPLPIASATDQTRTETERAKRTRVPGGDRKRRRIDGENDTERDIRHAQETQSRAVTHESRHIKRYKPSDAPLTDRAGHINLFPAKGPRRGGPKNPEAEAEAAAKKKEYEDQYTMRFSNAAGFKQAIGAKPWYHSGLEAGKEEEPDAVGKDVWGNEDPRRNERQKMRIVADDPLAAIQKGVKDLRQVERQKRAWLEEQKREIKAIEKAERRMLRKARGDHRVGMFDGFSLDKSEIGETPRHAGSKHRHGSHSKDGHHGISQERRHTREERHKGENITGWEVGPGGRYSTQFTDVKY